MSGRVEQSSFIIVESLFKRLKRELKEKPIRQHLWGVPLKVDILHLQLISKVVLNLRRFLLEEKAVARKRYLVVPVLLVL